MSNFKEFIAVNETSRLSSKLAKKLFMDYKNSKMKPKLEKAITEQLGNAEVSDFIIGAVEDGDNIQVAFDDVLAETLNAIVDDENFIEFYENL